MATIVGIEPALLEMARGMPVEAIPEKLRCATCDKLAISAVKIPCCDSTICTYCHAGLSDTECPICTHSPFTASMCVPAKGLQATVKAFIKTEAKKRATEAAAAPVKSIEKSASVAAVENQPSTADMQTPQPQNGAGLPIISDTPAGDAMENPAVAAAGAEAQLEQVMQRPIAKVEIKADEGKQTGRDEQIQKTTEDEDDQDGEDEDDDEDIVITTERSGEEHQDCQENGFPEDSSAMTQNGMSRQEGSNMPFQQNFNMMSMNGMDPAQVQFMQNMMGMSGMNMGMGMGMGPGMDPSMMFGNFGGMGGMNDMNMMSMMGMGGMNGMGDMGNFGGMGGPGFFPQGNYMQSNFGNQRQAPFFNNHGQGRPYGRGFGRGRGQYARGRGGWGQQQQYQQPYNQGGFHQQSDPTAQPDAPSRRGSPSYEGASEANGTPAVDGAPNQDDHAGHDDAPDANNADRADSAGGQTIEGAHSVQHEYDGHNGEYNNSNMDEGFDHNGGDYSQMPMMDPSGSFENQYQNFNDMGYQDQYGFNGGHRGGFNNRGGFGRGRGGYNGAHARGQDNTDLTPKSAPPLNAPTGPKALRQGLPNTGWSGRMATVPSAKQTPTTAVQSIGPDSENGDDAAHDRNQITDDRYQNGVNGKPESRNGRADSRSRSRSRNRSSKHRERSRSANEESEEARARRKERERERRKRKDRDRRYDEDDRARSRDGEDSRKRHRSRSRSPAEDSSRRHRRDDGDDYKSSRSRRERSKDRRRRRHRSRSGDRGDSDKHDDYSRRKERSRRDDDGGDGGHSSSRRHSRRDDDGYDDDRTRRSHHSGRDKDRNYHESSRAIVEPAIDDQLGFKIKGSKSAKSGSMGPPPTRERRSSHSESRDAPTTTSTSNSSDPYAEERARAQQNRVAAEAQRRQSSSLGKRSRHDDIADAPTGPRGMSSSAASSSSRSKKVKKDTRQISYKYEDEIGVDDRDSSRWR